jgi:serine/threonine-protein kinase
MSSAQRPEALGKYRVTGVLGEGAMGVVYQGFDPGIQRTVALKTMRRALADNPDADASGATLAARFRNEAQAAGRLQHPGIVAVYDYGEENDIAYIAMEYVAGATLARYLNQGEQPRFSEADTLSMVVQLLDALDHAHSHGVWHRDIKPANLLLTQDGRLKVADFGIARIASVNLTQVTSIVGTPGYMAPEQLLGRPLDGRADLYAVGVLLYQMLVGHTPFSGSIESLMYRVVNEMPPPPSGVGGFAHGTAYDSLLAKALAKQPETRFADAAAFKAALLANRNAPVPGRVSGDTLVLKARDAARAAGVVAGTAGTSGTAGTAGSQGGSFVRAAAPATAGGTTLSHWDPQVLAQVETKLARHLGPMASVLVRRTARDCQDLATLVARLAEQLTSVSARDAFLAQLQGAGGTVQTTPPPPGPASLALPVLPEALVQQATKLLASHVGPIASVVCKRAAAKAAHREDFFSQLEAAVPTPAGRQALRKELDKLR